MKMLDRLSGLKDELKLLEQSIDGLHKFYASNPLQKIKNKITFVVNFETQYEHTVNKPIKFLRFIKRFPLYSTREMPKVLEPYRYDESRLLILSVSSLFMMALWNIVNQYQ